MRYTRQGGANFAGLPVLEKGHSYLTELGVNALELLPAADSFFKRTWGYDTAHYLAPDWELGFPDGQAASTSNADLAALVEACHRHGIRFFIGDVLLVTRLDRLARSTRDLLNTLAAIADRKAGFRSLGDAWADTTTPHGRLMLTVLGGLAEFEKELIRARTGEGRERAKARGVKMGRKPKLTDHQKREAIRRRDIDGEPVREIARSYNVSHSTISRLSDVVR
jgi:hypothetical protein